MSEATQNMTKGIIKDISELAPYKIVLSGGRGEYRKVVLERKIIKGQRCYQIERYTDKQVFHENSGENDLVDSLIHLGVDLYRQINVFAAGEEWDIKVSKKGKLSVNKRKTETKTITISGNNRKKKYLKRGWTYRYSRILEYLQRMARWFIRCMTNSNRSTDLLRS